MIPDVSLTHILHQQGILYKDGQGHFLNARLMALNALEIDIPQTLISQCEGLMPDVRRVTARGETIDLPGGLRLSAETPKTWRSDICWLSHEDEVSFGFFENLFDRLGLAHTVATFVPHDRTIRLYAGFFVTRSRCDAIDLHCDWQTRDNHAFTLMAPLTGNCGELGLTYRTARGEERDYTYRLGKGLVFGTQFVHSTAVGRSAERSVFLCLNFGTDRMEHWPDLARTTGNQGNLHRRPDGMFVRTQKKDRTDEYGSLAGIRR